MKSESVADLGCAAAMPSCSLAGPVSQAVSRVARLYRMAAAKQLRGLGLYPGQELLMMHLWDAGPVRQSELIKVLDLDPSTVTKMLQRLELAGHVSRRPDPSDRRAVVVEATVESCGLRDAVKDACEQLEQQTLTGLEEGERAELIRLLEKVEGNHCGHTAGCE
ncbi:MarR family winged helix-turn-helix transcriptional regulator [Streptomyces sp. NPDC055078]